MNRSQAITRLTSIIDIRNEQISRLKEIQKEIKNIIKMGDKADEKLLALDQDKNVQEIFPRSLQEAMVEYNASPLTNDTIYDFLSDPDSDFRQLNVQKTLSKVLEYAEDETDDLPEHLEGEEEEDEDE
jgi:hypothetical protein